MFYIKFYFLILLLCKKKLYNLLITSGEQNSCLSHLNLRKLQENHI